MLPRKWKAVLKASRFIPGLVPIRPSHVCQTPFVLLARQRSGSTWIMDLLHSHPQVVGYAELFHSDEYGKPGIGGSLDVYLWNSWLAMQPPPRSRRELTRLYFNYLDDEVFREQPQRSAIGLKLMYNQAISHPAVPMYLQHRDVRIVHLIRRNHLDAILSQEAVRQRGISLANTGRDVKRIQINLEAHSIAGRIRQRASEVDAARDYCRFLGVSSCELFYEDVAEDVRALDTVLSFLNCEVSAAGYQSDMIKLNPKSHRELIANFDEVQQSLAGTEFSELLRE